MLGITGAELLRLRVEAAALRDMIASMISCWHPALLRTNFADDGLTSATFGALMFYRADGTSTYVGVMHITGTLDGRRGSFVLQGQGSYDGTTARGQSRVVERSGKVTVPQSKTKIA